ncbi:hypothetical protein M7I_0052 [Glarea lozoyensis 74030]|uniref:Uncharacterized protein n=1 Tax=Glarea lozoyensis (strain ATCC 74030 / MF5533) TaxID=1104152 RepID=H0ECB8_GLAL7|nr:hypothetical protein M7I_0052 [Glarea lozoyensis 74030]
MHEPKGYTVPPIVVFNGCWSCREEARFDPAGPGMHGSRRGAVPRDLAEPDFSIEPELVYISCTKGDII